MTNSRPNKPRVDGGGVIEYFRSRFNRGFAITIWVLCLAAIVAVVLAQDADSRNFLAPILLAIWAAWATFWQPFLAVSDEQIELQNVFSVIRIPWAALIDVDTRFALTLHTPRRKFTATVAPAPGRWTAPRATKYDTQGVTKAISPKDQRIRPSDLAGTDSGAAARLVRDRWDQLREEDRIPAGVADATPVSIRVRWVQLAIWVALIAVSIFILTF